jgi:hypothetical protein
MAAPVPLAPFTSGAGRCDVSRARYLEQDKAAPTACDMQRHADARIPTVYSGSGKRAILASARPRPRRAQGSVHEVRGVLRCPMPSKRSSSFSSRLRAEIALMR